MPKPFVAAAGQRPAGAGFWGGSGVRRIADAERGVVSEVWQVPPHDSRAETPALPRLDPDLAAGQGKREGRMEEGSTGGRAGGDAALEFKDADMRELLRRLSQI